MKTLFSILLITIAVSLAAALAPLYGVGQENTIPDEYIVVLNEDITVEMRDSHVSELQAVLSTATVRTTFAIGTLIGFSVVMDKSALARELEHPDVKYIEANGRVHVLADDALTQEGAEWGLGRIGQRDIASNNKYTYYESAGAGTVVYVIDTGVLVSHNEFVGRAEAGPSFVAGESAADCNGHGTHVAGTSVGTVYGVAKKATVVGVKVLGCSGGGTYEGVIQGIQWALDDFKRRFKRAVANMSLGGGVSAAVNQAVNNAVAGGLSMVVAAGNNGLNACNYSPASAVDAITVGATQLGDAKASYSNIGNCVDIFAPGSNVKGPWYTSNSAVNTISGTSMASPHVAGAVAVYLGHRLAVDPNGHIPTPKEVTEYLVGQATKNKITSPGANSPNLLLFSPSS